MPLTRLTHKEKVQAINVNLKQKSSFLPPASGFFNHAGLFKRPAFLWEACGISAPARISRKLPGSTKGAPADADQASVTSVTKKPDFFIVGAPKSGTTAMAHYLSARPDIFMARKEMHFFGDDLGFAPQFYRRNLSAYAAEFEGWNGQRRSGEASVWVSFSQQAAAEIKAFNPDARIIIMLRDPVEMLHSLYYTFRWDGNEHLSTFAEALDAQEDRRAGRRITRQTYFAPGLVYREAVAYTEQVRRYFNVFGRDRVHVIIYEGLRRLPNVAATCQRAIEFLEVDTEQIQDNFKPVNANKFVKSRVLRALLSDRLVRSSVLAIRPWLPRGVFSAMQKVDARIRKLNSRHGGRPPLAPELCQQLKRDLAPEVEHLSILLERDLSHWKAMITANWRIMARPRAAHCFQDRSGHRACRRARRESRQRRCVIQVKSGQSRKAANQWILAKSSSPNWAVGRAKWNLAVMFAAQCCSRVPGFWLPV